MKLNKKLMTITFLILLILSLISFLNVLLTPLIINKCVSLFITLIFLVITISIFNFTDIYISLKDEHKEKIKEIREYLLYIIKIFTMSFIFFLVMFNSLKTNVQNECNEYILINSYGCEKDINGKINCDNIIDGELPFESDYNFSQNFEMIKIE